MTEDWFSVGLSESLMEFLFRNAAGTDVGSSGLSDALSSESFLRTIVSGAGRLWL